MLRIKIGLRIKRKTTKDLKKKRLFFFFLIFVFLSSLPFKLSANTNKEVSFALHLKEWLVLELSSDDFQVNDIGHRQAQGEVMIVPGQPLFVRALLAIGHGKKVILKGTLFFPEKLNSKSDLIGKWRGEGDLAGSGLINLNESMTLAIWESQSLKTGTIIFENIDERSPVPLKGVFALIIY